MPDDEIKLTEFPLPPPGTGFDPEVLALLHAAFLHIIQAMAVPPEYFADPPAKYALKLTFSTRKLTSPKHIKPNPKTKHLP